MKYFLLAALLSGCASIQQDSDRQKWRHDVLMNRMGQDEYDSLVKGQKNLKEMQP